MFFIFAVGLKAEAATQRNRGAAVILLSVATFSLRFSNSYKLDGDKAKRLAGVILLPPPPNHSLCSQCVCVSPACVYTGYGSALMTKPVLEKE